MSMDNLEKKLALYQEFFTIEHDFSVNIVPIENQNNLTFEQFNASMPMPFKLATEVNAIDQAALQSFKNTNSSGSLFVNLFNQQSQKIDLLIGYILSQQDEVQHRFQGTCFGGGGIKFTSDKDFGLGQILELKIFLLENNCAVFCYGEIIEKNTITDNAQALNEYKVTFHFIREEDRETLVRASLHEQAKQLQKLAKQRNQSSEVNK